jgi:hypothetical protein
MPGISGIAGGTILGKIAFGSLLKRRKMQVVCQALEPRRLFSAGLVAQYFSDAKFSNLVDTGAAAQIDFDWSGSSPDPSITTNTYSIRWTGTVQAQGGGRYRFALQADAGVKLKIDSKTIVGRSQRKKIGQSTGSFKLVAGQSYSIEVDLVEKAGSASIAMLWAPPGQSMQIVPNSALGNSDSGSAGSGSGGGAGNGSIPFAVPTMPSNWSGPIVISQGGTYSGNWQSLDPNRTSDPVTIDNANIQSWDDLIDTDIAGANLTVENTSGWALNPDAQGQTPGRFLDADGFNSITVENDFLDGTSGIELSHYAGNDTATQTITVDKNLALNIDGRESTGKGGYSTSQSQDVQFLQLSHDSDLVGAEIAWNQVFNQPGQSRVEDNISIFESGGTPASHLEIHDNFIDGGYPADPTDSNYSGGGILLGDGDGTVEPAGNVDAYNNQVLNTTNYGIAIAADSNDTISNNRVISTGALPDGTPLPAENVGIYIWQNNPGSFSNNVSTGNVIGWQVVSSSGAISRNDEWLPDAEPGTTGQDTSLPGPITQATEQNEYSLWATKLQQNGVTVGPT